MTPVPSTRSELRGNAVRRLLRRGGRAKIVKMLQNLRPEDLAVMLRGFTPDEQVAVFQILLAEYAESAIGVLTEMDPQERPAILEALGPERSARLLERAAVDDAVHLLDTLPEELKQQMLAVVDLEDRLAQVQHHLTYQADSAGRVMDSEYIALEQTTTVAEAIESMRRIAHDVEMISYLYVVDAGGHLVGVTPLRQLLLAEPQAMLSDIMNRSIIKVRVDTDQEDVAQLAARYDLLAIPVVDDDNKLVGIVTIDDIVDIVKDEATEDFYKLAGTSDDEIVYQDRSWKVLRIRLPWILFNLMGAMVAGFLFGLFEGAFELALLITFIPVVMAMGGNIGTQTSTIAVRALATGRVALGQGRVRPFVWQQTKVGILLGLTCASAVAAVAFALSRDPAVTLAVGCSLFLAMLSAAVNGSLIPVAFERLGIDPAVASGPLVTTLNDILGVALYFGLATLFLKTLSGVL